MPTKHSTWTYQYDANDRLWRMSKTGKSLEFKYDYIGRRVDAARKREDGQTKGFASATAEARSAGCPMGGAARQKKVWNATNTFTGTPATHLKFAYQGMELVADAVRQDEDGRHLSAAVAAAEARRPGSPLGGPTRQLNSSGGLRKSFHWGIDKSDTRGGAGGAMGLLMWRDYVRATDRSYYPSYDLNGNVTGLLDDSGNYVAWYDEARQRGDGQRQCAASAPAEAEQSGCPLGGLFRQYDAFGKVVTEGGTMKDANPIRFSTQYTDDETGLVYYGFRHYDPSKGRFLTRDPIGEAGGLNLYRFVGNDPVNRVDVWGLTPVYMCDIIRTEHSWSGRVFSVTYEETNCRYVGELEDLWGKPGNDGQSGNSGSDVGSGGDGTNGGSVGDDNTDTPPKENEEEKPKLPPCSEVRKQLLGDLLPNTNSVDGVVDGARSYTPGLMRGFEGGALGYTPFGILFFGERSAAIRQADQTLRDFAVAYATDEEVQRQTNAIGEVFVRNNIGRFAGRAGAAVTVGQVIQRGIGGSGWYGPLLGSLAIRGDVNYMIRNNVDPALAVAAGIMGATSAEAMGEFAKAMSDKELTNIIPCEEGK